MPSNKTLIVTVAAMAAAYALYKRKTSLQSAVQELINDNPEIF